jgi:hypothetical protein
MQWGGTVVAHLADRPVPWCGPGAGAHGDPHKGHHDGRCCNSHPSERSSHGRLSPYHDFSAATHASTSQTGVTKPPNGPCRIHRSIAAPSLRVAGPCAHSPGRGCSTDRLHYQPVSRCRHKECSPSVAGPSRMRTRVTRKAGSGEVIDGGCRLTVCLSAYGRSALTPGSAWTATTHPIARADRLPSTRNASSHCVKRQQPPNTHPRWTRSASTSE